MHVTEAAICCDLVWLSVCEKIILKKSLISKYIQCSIKKLLCFAAFLVVRATNLCGLIKEGHFI